MARLIKTTVTQKIICQIVTEFTDGTKNIKDISIGDVVENLRYVENEEICTVTGKVKDIKLNGKKVSKVSLSNPIDYFSTDVCITKLIIDASDQYASNVVTVNAREIIEDSGVENVTRVYTVAHPVVELDMYYSNDTIEHQSIEVGDILNNVKILTRPNEPDIVGNFSVPAFGYTIYSGIPTIRAFYLTPEGGGVSIKADINKILVFNEVPQVEVTATNSLGEIANALATSEIGRVAATLGADVTIPTRDDGKITTLFVGEGKTLDIDLNGHDLSVDAYAFYVNGGTVNISDSTGTGKIKARMAGKTYGVVQVMSNGVCNMDSGIIDTTEMEATTEKPNWMYGVVCSGNGIFNMTGGELHTAEAAGISITNGTATGEGAQFIIGGDAVIKSDKCSAVYLADNKSVVIKDNAKVYGGIMARMGDITIEDNAYVEGANYEVPTSIGAAAAFSGCDAMNPGIIGFTGIYGSALGNDMNVTIADSATVKSTFGDAVVMATCNNKYDQTVRVNIDSESNMDAAANKWAVLDHDTLAAQAAAEGRTLGPEAYTTDLVINIAGEQVYPTV